jgi:hypothetical protein
MHDEITPAQEDDQIDRAILSLLLNGAAWGPWSDDEVARELGDEVATADGLARLAGAGLVHRLKPGFVWPSRAALHGARL